MQTKLNNQSPVQYRKRVV
ncbi:hypothetical protein [Priestia flexa]